MGRVARGSWGDLAALIPLSLPSTVMSHFCSWSGETAVTVGSEGPWLRPTMLVHADDFVQGAVKTKLSCIVEIASLCNVPTSNGLNSDKVTKRTLCSYSID